MRKNVVKVHVIIVGFMRQSSEGRAAAIIGSAKPAEALAFNEAHFDLKTESGGIGQSKSKNSIDLVLDNNKWASAHGVIGTPCLIFRTKQGYIEAMSTPMHFANFIENIKVDKP